MNRFVWQYIILFWAFVLYSCKEPAPQIPYNKIEKPKTSEYMMELNKEFYAIEDSLINAYIDSLNIPFQSTKSGLRYYIIQEGEGREVSKLDMVTFRYSIKLLDGTICEKLSDVVKTESLEKNELERGFREALLLLKVSGTGLFVMPSYLAYGVIGIPGTIPAWTPVECKITILEVKNK